MNFLKLNFSQMQWMLVACLSIIANFSFAQSTCTTGNVLTAASGVISDGSGAGSYSNNASCDWLIQPAGGGAVVLNFISFELEGCCDYVRIYDGVDASGTQLGSFNGTTLPPTMTANSGSMFITFTSDGSVTYDGFTAVYGSGVIPFASQQQGVTCPGGTDGIVEITVYGDTTPPFTVNGTQYTTNPFTISGLPVGTQTFLVSNSTGDTASVTATINGPGPIPFTFDTLANVSCNGGNDGIVEISTPSSSDSFQVGQFANGFPNVQKLVTDGTNVYASITLASTVYKVSPTGSIDTLITPTGDGTNSFDGSYSLALDAQGNLYVTGNNTSNAFKIEPNGTITQIIDSNGDSTNNLYGSRGIAVDAQGNVYVAGYGSNNVFKIEPNGTITQIIDSNGDGTNNLLGPEEVVVDGNGNIYVSGRSSDNVFKIEPNGTITEVIDLTGDGSNLLYTPTRLALDANDNLFVIGQDSDNAFKITPTGTITQIIDNTGDGTHSYFIPISIQTDAANNVYTVGYNSRNVFQITPNGAISQIMDNTTDGNGGFTNPSFRGLAVGNNTIYVSDYDSGIIFEIGKSEFAFSANGTNFQSSNQFTALAAGNYTFTILDSLTGCTLDTILTITEPTAISIATTSESDSAATGVGSATATVTGGVAPYTYNWDNGATTETAFNLMEGTYSVTVTDANGCTQVASVVVENIGVSTSSINYITTLNIFPNPTRGNTTIELSLDRYADVSVKLYNVAGQMVEDFGQRNTTNEVLQLDLSNHSGGMYFVQFIIDGDVVTRKLMLNK